MDNNYCIAEVEYRFNGSNWRTFTAKDRLTKGMLTCGLQDDKGNLWFGQFNGLSRYDGTNWQTFTTQDGLAHNTVMAMAKDDKGNLWSGTLGGVSRYNPTKSQ